MWEMRNAHKILVNKTKEERPHKERICVREGNTKMQRNEKYYK
jgi:hypothetical protein